MKDPYFEETLIVLCQYSEEGALGVIINRMSNLSLNDILRQIELPNVEKEKSVLWGGPVKNGVCFVVFEGSITPTDGWSIQSQIAISPSLELLKQRITNNQPFDLIIGYSGWGPGQLENEITKGSWLYADDINLSILLSSPIEQRYDKALQQLGLSKTTVWMTPIDE